MKQLLLIFTLIFSTQAHCAFQNVDIYSRDLCETNIKSIVHVFQQWIATNKHKELKFESDLSAFLYQDGMMRAANNLEISCVPLLAFHPAQKPCTNIDETIVCSYHHFLASDSMTQYKLIHHELAVIAGSENDKNNQYSYYLTEQLDELFRLNR